MGLKLEQSNGLSRELRLADGFTVTVRYLQRTELERLQQACEGKDEEEQAMLASKAYIAGWTDLRPATVRKLGAKIDLDNQPTDKDGCIPYDADTARDLWRHTFAGEFQLKIMACSRQMLAAIEAEKELAKNGFGGWSQPSTTL